MNTKKLIRELQRETLLRLDDSARSEEEFIEITDWWDRLVKNRAQKDSIHVKEFPVSMNSLIEISGRKRYFIT